jgi:hypothetical protein
MINGELVNCLLVYLSICLSHIIESFLLFVFASMWVIDSTDNCLVADSTDNCPVAAADCAQS